MNPRRQAEIGLAYGLAAYLWWGFIPIYFKLVAHIPPLVVLGYRVIWSFLFLAALVAFKSAWSEFIAALRNRRVLLMLAVSTALLAVNWGTFIYAITVKQAIQASLGYFINPIVSVALAMIFLHERLRPWQRVGLGVAAAGVGVLTAAGGQLPWIALALAFSFGGYGLLRKLAHVGPLVGVALETALLVPVAAGYIAYAHTAESTPPLDGRSFLLLSISGIVTALPLLWFTAAARRLRLSTLGFLQYVGPICQFLLARFAFGEPFSAANFAGFALIWSACAIYALDSLRAYRAARDEREPAVAPVTEM